jgi:hypothetical protein
MFPTPCRWQKFIVAKGKYFEENVGSMTAMFCISQK